MVRARRKDHLRNLQKRFTVLAGAEIATWPNRDYRYRLIAPKSVWVSVLAGMADEQEWSNFKNEAAKRQGKSGREYLNALHDVWEAMHRLQESGELKNRW